MSVGENPYASPQTVPELQAPSRIQSLKWLRGAAMGILVFAGFNLFMGVCWFVTLPLMIAMMTIYPLRDQSPVWLVGLGWLGSILFSVYSGFMFYGATHLRAAKSYRWALASVILSLLGIFHPITWLQVPFGIWALVMLLRKDTRAVFTEDD